MKNFPDVLTFLLRGRFGSTIQAQAILKHLTVRFSQYLYRYALLIVIAALSACSRPVAYFQRTEANLLTTLNTQSVPQLPMNQGIASPLEPVLNANTTVPQPEFAAYANNKLIPTKPLSKRTDQVKAWLISTPETVKPQGNFTAGRMSTIERGRVPKISQKKSGQLAPSVPTKARANWIKLIGGVILLIAGGAIMLAGPGSIFFLGLVVALFGFVGIILGLFAE